MRRVAKGSRAVTQALMPKLSTVASGPCQRDTAATSRGSKTRGNLRVVVVYAKLTAMEVVIRKLFAVMPLLFGIGFIAPLTAQLMAYWGIEGPLGMSRIGCGLLLGGAWGLYANIKGRWI